MRLKPHVNKYPIRKLRLAGGAKSVSIAIANICIDGLIICADQQITTPDFKYYESKISQIPLAPKKGKVVVAYAGLPDTMKVLMERLRDKLEGQDKGTQQIKDDLKSVLDLVLSPESEDAHQLLFAFEEAGGFRLIKTRNKELYPVDVWDCIGFGDSALTRYLGAIFLESYVHLDLARAVPICAYMLKQAKKYVQGCGGPTDLIVLDSKGQVRQYCGGSRFDDACEGIEYCLNRVLTEATEPNVKAERIQQLIEELRKIIENESQIMIDFLTYP